MNNLQVIPDEMLVIDLDGTLVLTCPIFQGHS